MHLKSSVLDQVSGILHGFGTADEPIPLPFEKDWAESRPVWKQVHGDSISKVETPRQECGEVDAVYTHKLNMPIGIVTADCVPVLLAHRHGQSVAAVHAGWRGTKARILRTLWKELIQSGENPKDWVAAVGPAIGPCCYEVSQELSEEFRIIFQHLGPGIAVPRERFLDLPAIQAGELVSLGLSQVDLIRACTLCSESPRFNSYRRTGTTSKARQYSLIARIKRKETFD